MFEQRKSYDLILPPAVGRWPTVGIYAFLVFAVLWGMPRVHSAEAHDIHAVVAAIGGETEAPCTPRDHHRAGETCGSHAGYSSCGVISDNEITMPSVGCAAIFESALGLSGMIVLPDPHPPRFSNPA